MATENTSEFKTLRPYLSPAAAFALATGTSVGWGSLMVTSTSYLSAAGPAGSVIGLMVGGLLMMLIARSFEYLAERYPDAGGIYTYTKNIFGYDRAFLVSWFLGLTYISMFWANATSLPLFARYFLKGAFSFGYMYTVFGYDVYLGEALLTLFAIFMTVFLCIRSKEAAARFMILMVLVFSIGITVCFLAALLASDPGSFVPKPYFVPDSSALSQVIHIIFISPWAFAGFENITHSSEEFTFRTSRLFRILMASVITSTLLYVFVTLLSVSAYPADCRNWFEYITNLSAYQGIEGIPAFFAARHYLGNTGVYLLMASLLALVLTSLIGNLRALSRLFYAIARDDILPAAFSELNEHDIPANAMILVGLLSLPVPFLGRTTIGWIVDITTIGSTIIYGFAAAAAYKLARSEGDRRNAVLSGISVLIMVVFGIYLLFPNLFSDNSLATETYILLIVWSLIGFFYFRQIIAKDHARRFGKAIIVWIALLAFIIMMALIWSDRMIDSNTNLTIATIQEYYHGTAAPHLQILDEETFIREQISGLHWSNTWNSLIIIFLFALGLGAMLINHFSMRKWEKQIASERDTAYEVAYKDPLTGVKSKHAYVEHERKMAEQIYDEKAEPFAVAVCDVNGLKHVNDTLGHEAGDRYICNASELICGHFKHSPVYRIGGDEFAIILQGHDYEHRHEIIAALNEEIEHNLGTDKVIASIGMAEYDEKNDHTFHAVFARADALMYERKQELKAMGAITRD